MATKNQIRGMLRRKKKAGLLPPPECPNCGADLRDPDVPSEYQVYRSLFGLAREIQIDMKTAMWMCPVCQHGWGKHEWTGSSGRREFGS